jgi:hypothetical protein
MSDGGGGQNVAELSRARVAVAATRRARAGVDSLTSYHRSDGVSP